MLGSMQPAPLILLCLKNEAGEHGLKGRTGPGELWPLREGPDNFYTSCCSVGPRRGPSTGRPGLWA